LHCKACDVLFVQEMRELGARAYTPVMKRMFCFLLRCLRLDDRQTSRDIYSMTYVETVRTNKRQIPYKMLDKAN